jgi:hypothetical protein
MAARPDANLNRDGQRRNVTASEKLQILKALAGQLALANQTAEQIKPGLTRSPHPIQIANALDGLRQAIDAVSQITGDIQRNPY